MKKVSTKYAAYLTIGIICILIVIAIGTYAIFMRQNMQSSTNVMGTLDCVNISIIGNNEALNLDAAYPISNREGLSQIPYNFTVKNNCDSYVEYKILLSVLNTTTLTNKEYVKVDLEGPIKLKSKKISELQEEFPEGYINSGFINNFTLISNNFKGNQSHTYNFRMWLNGDNPDIWIDDTIANQNLSVKISIIGITKTEEPQQLLKDAILAQEGGSSAILTKTSPDFSSISPKKTEGVIYQDYRILIEIPEDEQGDDGGTGEEEASIIANDYELNPITGYFKLLDYKYEILSLPLEKYIGKYICLGEDIENCELLMQIRTVNNSSITSIFYIYSGPKVLFYEMDLGIEGAAMISSMLSSQSQIITGDSYDYAGEYGNFYLIDYTFSNPIINQSYINKYICLGEPNQYDGCIGIIKIEEVTESEITKAKLIMVREEYEVNLNDTGLYAAEDEYGTSYYYRGSKNNLNNNLLFGGFQWKIIRINGDGSIRIVYHGTEEYFYLNNKMNVFPEYAFTGRWNENYYNDNKYIGYMYGGLNGVASTVRNGITSNAATYNETSSNAKILLENWYHDNLLGSPFENKIVDNIFCNDRTLQSEVGGPPTGLGYGESSTYYSGYHRLFTNQAPTLKCLQQNDRFTVNDVVKGNGALTYPIGLITADEASMSGLICDEINIYNYLFMPQMFIMPFSMTPASRGILFDSSLDSPFNDVDNEGGFLPVINLSSETRIIGQGSIDNPYILVN